jgi:hypothetical protein
MKSLTSFLSLLIILITIYWSFYDMKPNYSDKDTENNKTSDTELAIPRALSHLKNIAEKPHHVGTESHTKVQNYLLQELSKLGLKPELQIQTAFNEKWKAGTTVENIVAKINGSSNGKSLLVASHYDSNPHSSIGASDAGSGVVTILEGIRAYLATNKVPKNDIIILFTDAEELGLLGAEAFVQHHPYAKKVGLVLNFEARGSGGPSYMLMETNGKNSKLLAGFQKANSNYPAANSLMYSVYKMLPNDTDLTVFREKANINGFNFAFIGDHFDYHSAQDTYDRLDRSSLAHQKDYFENSLAYFAEADLSQLDSNTDDVFVNFPLIGLLTFPFAWILPIICIASLVFIFLIITGIKRQKLFVNQILKGSIPFLLSLFLCVCSTILLWKLILVIHPSYKDILHGFPYNGYTYIMAFSLLNIWLVFKIYTKFKKLEANSLLIFPVLFWLILNLCIYVYLKGAAFFILPVFCALTGLALSVYGNSNHKSLIYTIILIPTIYIFSPLIKMFPVGLGLKNLFISALFIVLILGLLIPTFHQKNNTNKWTKWIGITTIISFGIATFNSGFSIESKKPNSLVYIQNVDTQTALWGTYNTTLDEYTAQIFDGDYNAGGIKNAETANKYNRKFKFSKKTEFRKVKTSAIDVIKDTTIANVREIWMTITPRRNVSKYEIFVNNKISLNKLEVNSCTLYQQSKELERRRLFTYHMGNRDEKLHLKFSYDSPQKIDLTLNEISNDLLEHPLFNLSPRNENMMPMPFVTNDAIISSKSIIIKKNEI